MKLATKRGQAMAECIIIVVVVAIAALAVFGVFSDTLRKKLGGASEKIGGDAAKINDAVQTPSEQILRNMSPPSGN